MDPQQVTPMAVAAGMFATAVLALGGMMWALAIARLATGQPLLAWSPRRPVPWGLVDVGLVVVIYLALNIGLSIALVQLDWLPPKTLAQRQAVTIGGISVSLLTVLFGLGLVTLRTGASINDWGLAGRRIGSDLVVGIAAFAMLAPPVLALQAVLVHFWKPSNHPLIELFKASPDAGLFLLLFTAAVVVAPLVEELIFRVLLQGFLEAAATTRGDFSRLLLGCSRKGGATPIVADVVPAIVDQPIPAVSADLDFVRPPSDPPDPEYQPPLRWLQAALPIGISSLIFALLHYSHGPDWIPLTLLAAGMGYVYQRTHSLLPSLVVHVLLNGFSMWVFWIQMFAAPK